MYEVQLCIKLPMPLWFFKFVTILFLLCEKHLLGPFEGFLRWTKLCWPLKMVPSIAKSGELLKNPYKCFSPIKEILPRIFRISWALIVKVSLFPPLCCLVPNSQSCALSNLSFRTKCSWINRIPSNFLPPFPLWLEINKPGRSNPHFFHISTKFCTLWLKKY